MTYEEEIEVEVERRYPTCPRCGEALCACIDEEYGIVRCALCGLGICLETQAEEHLYEVAAAY